MEGRREVSFIFYRPVTRSDLKQERSFFRGSVSLFLQVVVAFVTSISFAWLVSCVVGLTLQMVKAMPEGNLHSHSSSVLH